MSGGILQCFLDSDLRNGHDGLSSLAKKNGIQTSDLNPGEFVVFINTAKTKVKVYAARNTIVYLRMAKGERVNLNIIREIPRVFKGGMINYDSALGAAVIKQMATHRKANGPLAAYRAEKRAGLN